MKPHNGSLWVPGHVRPSRVAQMRPRYKYWCDVDFPGDLARAIVVAKREGRVPPHEPEQCPNRECQTCWPRRDEHGKFIPPEHR